MSRKKPIEINIGETIKVYPDGVYLSKVIPSGQGAVVSSFKRFIGKEVIVIVSDRIKKERKSLGELLDKD